MRTIAACCIFTLLSLGALTGSGHAQAPDIEWSHHYPRDGSSAALALALMPDGGFLIGGYTVPPGDVYRDIFLIRTNSEGDTLFTRRFGASDRGESLVSMKPMFDGGFIVSGPFHGVPPMTSSADVYLLQIDANAQYVWSNLYGLTTESESPACAIQTVDTALMFVRYQWQSTTGHDIILTGLNAAGGVAWERQYAWQDAEYVVELCRTRDNGLMLAGQTQSADAEYDWDIYLLKTTGGGDSIWCRTYGLAWPSDETATHVVETSDGGFLVSGSRETDTSPKDMLIIKTDSQGLVDWSYEIGSNYHDQARFGIETSDGGYAVVGSWADDTWDNIVIKFDANGDTVWTRIFGDTTTDDVAHAMVETLDGGLVVTGTSSGTAFPGGAAAYLTKIGGDPAIDVITHRTSSLGAAIGSSSPTQNTITVSPRVREIHSEPLRGVLVHIDTLVHPVTSDLEISLTHEGVTALLVNRAGAGGNDFVGTVFSDVGQIPVKHGTAPFSGIYIPEESLSLFAGSDPSGDWTLTITDHEAANDGVLDAWGVTLLFDVVTGIDDVVTDLPSDFQLGQNYPNPFNPATSFSYSLAVKSHVCIDVYNVLGQRVTRLVETEKPAGEYVVTWDGRNELGRPVSSGVYFYRLQASGIALSRKMVYLK